MKWLWWRRAPRVSGDAEEAAQRARRCLADARNFEVRANRVSRDLTETLRRNHFAAAVARAMRGEA